MSPDWATFFTSCGCEIRVIAVLSMGLPPFLPIHAWLCFYKPGVYSEPWKVFHELQPQLLKPLKVCLSPPTVPPPTRTGMRGARKHWAEQKPTLRNDQVGRGSPFPESPGWRPHSNMLTQGRLEQRACARDLQNSMGQELTRYRPRAKGLTGSSQVSSVRHKLLPPRLQSGR